MLKNLNDTKELRKVLNELDNEKLGNVITPHIWEEHNSKSSADMIFRAHNEQKDFVSTFKSRDDLIGAYRSLIKNNASGYLKEMRQAIKEGKATFNVTLPGDFAGKDLYGIHRKKNGDIVEIKTKGALHGTFRPARNSALGAVPVTFHPDFSDSYAKETGRDLSKEIVKDKRFKECTNAEKAYLLCATDPGIASESKKWDKDKDTTYIKFKEKECNIFLVMSSNETYLHLNNGMQTKDISLNDENFKKNFPETSAKIDAITAKVDKSISKNFIKSQNR